MKDKITTIWIITTTIALSIVAIFTVTRLYQLIQEPESSARPVVAAAETTAPDTSLDFSLDMPTNSPTANPNLTPTPTPAQNSGCNSSCESNLNCQSGFICSNNLCRNSSCPTTINCQCGEETIPSPTPSSPAIPVTGMSLPSVLVVGAGLLIIISSLALVL